jgi:cytoskeletal protein CcmA (bactofilin family)
MFGKNPQGVEPSTPVSSPSPPPFSATPSPAPRPVPASSKTLIGSGSRLVGDLISDEDVMLEGQIEGKVRSERTVTVGAGGELEGDVQAKSVIVGGKVRGQIVASERAELAATAVVHGSVQAPKIIIAEGAHLQGNVAMSIGGEMAAPAPRKSEGS